jgi:hypothetical protein
VEHAPELETVDLLCADVEGWELHVMKGFSAHRYLPAVIILENLFGDEQYVSYMRSIGYSFVQRIGPNDIYERTMRPRFAASTGAQGLWSFFAAWSARRRRRVTSPGRRG